MQLTLNTTGAALMPQMELMMLVNKHCAQCQTPFEARLRQKICPKCAGENQRWAKRQEAASYKKFAENDRYETGHGRNAPMAMTFEEIGAKLHVSKQRAQQLFQRGLVHLRSRFHEMNNTPKVGLSALREELDLINAQLDTPEVMADARRVEALIQRFHKVEAELKRVLPSTETAE